MLEIVYLISIIDMVKNIVKRDFSVCRNGSLILTIG